MDNLTTFALVGLMVLFVYILLVWFTWKRLKQTSVSCPVKSLFLAIFLAPGLLILGDHGALVLPGFAWMVAINNSYNCIQHSIFCSVKLNLLLAVLPFIATWIFAWYMCRDNDSKSADQIDT